MKPWTLRGGVAVITGAASGIGAALAVELARRGMSLALVDLNDAGLEATATQARAASATVSTHTMDVADHAAVAALPAAVMAVHGRVSVLVNNAGVALGGLFEQVDAEDFDWLMAINFGATVRLTRAFLPVLAREPAAQVVNVSSIFGIIAPPAQTAYAASKFAVRGFSESLRHELQMNGSPVGVTIVHPGGVRTAISENARLAKGLDAADVQRERANWRRLLALAPEKAAETIAIAIERRDARVLVGQDAKAAAFVQRLFPVSYWKHVARDIARRVQRKAA
ncbi:MAG: SDR family NAD(P)-dependent oxidoreductase [Vitreoscilla sp.]